MTKKTRWILFLLAVGAFIIVSYATVVHALGYRFDTLSWTFVPTGSLRVISNTSAQVYFNGDLVGKTSFLGDNFAKGNLLPRTYLLRLEREGYHAWQKSISINAGMFSDFPKVVLLPEQMLFEAVATTSFGFPLDDSRVRVTDDKVLTFSEHQISVEWLERTKYQPFYNEGDEEIIMRLPTSIDDVQWYRDREHILISSGGLLYFSEIDKRGGINSFQLTALKGPFWYSADENTVYLMEDGDLVGAKLE